MKLTKSKLKRIIKEGLTKSLDKLQLEFEAPKTQVATPPQTSISAQPSQFSTEETTNELQKIVSNWDVDPVKTKESVVALLGNLKSAVGSTE